MLIILTNQKPGHSMTNSHSPRQFGSLLFSDLLTRDLILSQIRSAIPPVTWIDTDKAQGVASLRAVEDPSLTATQHELTFKSRITLSLRLKDTIIHASLPFYRILFELSIIFRAFKPLLIIADIPLLKSTDIILEIENPSLIDILADLAFRSLILDKVCEAINSSISNSIHSRLIDLGQELFESSKPALKESNQQQSTKSLISLWLSPNDSRELEISAHQKELIKLNLYATRENPSRGLMDYDVGAKLDIRGNGIFLNCSSDSGIFSPTYEFDSTDWLAPNIHGINKVRVSSHGFTDNLLIKIIVSRKLADGKGYRDNTFILSELEQIDFNSLGEEIIRSAISTRVLKDQITTALIQLQANKKLAFDLDLNDLGNYILSLIVKKVSVVKQPSINTEPVSARHKVTISAFFQATRKITPKLTERLFLIPISIPLDIIVRPVFDPVGIEIVLDKIDPSLIALDLSKLEAIDELTKEIIERILLNDISEILAQKAMGVITSLLPISLSTTFIFNIASGIIRGTYLASPSPRKIFNGLQYKNLIVRNNSTLLRSFCMSAGDRAKLVAIYELINECEIKKLFVSICDGNHGILLKQSSTDRKGRISLELKAPYDGVYFLHLAASNSGWTSTWSGYKVSVSITKKI